MVFLAADSQVEAGWLGLLVIGLLGIAVFFLYRSMTKHLRRVPATFDPPPGSADDVTRQDPPDASA